MGNQSVESKHNVPRCRRCLRLLIGKKSIERGMGNRCYRKVRGPGRPGRPRKLKTKYDWRQLELFLVEEVKADETKAESGH
jgi:hypothetical protein